MFEPASRLQQSRDKGCITVLFYQNLETSKALFKICRGNLKEIELSAVVPSLSLAQD
jgi:hypothetical protein